MAQPIPRDSKGTINVQWNPAKTHFLNSQTGQWHPAAEYFEVFSGEPVRPVPFGMPTTGTPAMPGQGTMTYSSTPGGTTMEPESGRWDSTTGWLSDKLGGISGADWLQAIGSGVGTYLDYQQNERGRAMSDAQFQAGLAQRAREFERTQAQREAQQAVEAETRLNKAPLADKSQAILLARMGAAPEAFTPRDITKGTGSFRAGSSGGPGNVTRSLQDAARTYQPGAGGVKTNTIQAYLDKMRRSSGLTT